MLKEQVTIHFGEEMTETLNLRRIFQQILQDYKNLEIEGHIKRPRSRQELLTLMQQQILGRPRIVLSRINADNAEKCEKMHSSRNSRKKFAESDHLSNIKPWRLDVGNMEDNLLMMRNLIEIGDHTIPFIDFSPIIEENDEPELYDTKEEAKEEKTKKDDDSEQNLNKVQNTSCAFSDLAIDAEIVEMMESLIREENEKMTANKLTEETKKCPVVTESENFAFKSRGGRRIRKPVIYDDDLSDLFQVEPASKKKRRPKKMPAPKVSTLKLENDVVKVESRPKNSSVRPEVEILFPASLQEHNLKISLDLNKLDLPPNTFANILNKTKPNTAKSKQKSKKAKDSVQDKKSDLAKYFECFSTNCECTGQNNNVRITSTQSESPQNAITTTTVDNLQDQISTTQIETTVPTFLTSNERGEWILTTQPVPGAQIVTTSSIDTSQQPQQQTTSVKSTAVTSTETTTQGDEDFIIPMDIENNAYRLVQFIENDTEIFTSQSTTTSQQPTHLDVSNISNPENIRNSRMQVMRNSLQLTKITQNSKKNFPLPSTSPSSERKLFSRFDDNKMRAHASSYVYRSYTPWHDVLDLSAQKSKNNVVTQDGDIIDLSVKSDSNLFNQNVVENPPLLLDCTVKNIAGNQSDSSIIQKTFNTNKTSQDNQKDRCLRKISLNEYQKRNKDLIDNKMKSSVTVLEKDSGHREVDVSEKPQTVESISEKCQPAEKVFPVFKDMPLLNDELDLDYEFENSFKELSSTPLHEKARPSVDVQVGSPVTKDSGRGSTDCGNESKKSQNSSGSDQDNLATFYADKGLESLISDHDMDEDDALSIYANSMLGSPLNASDTNEENLRDICTPEFEQPMSFVPATEISSTKPILSSSASEHKFELKSNPPSSSTPVFTAKMSNYPVLPPAKNPEDILKNFKIPKIKSSSTSQPLNHNLMSSSNTLHPLEGVNLFQSGLSRPIERTKSISPEPGSSPSNQSSVSVNSLPPEKEMNNRKVVICSIFGNPCFANLSDSCKKNRCHYSHKMLAPNVLKSRLMHLSSVMLTNAYKFVWRNYKLFMFYFRTFCEIYGERGEKNKLVSMIKDCEMYSDSLRFLKHIVDALIKAGVSHVNAVKILVNAVKGQSQELMDLLIELMLDSDVLQFLEKLEAFRCNPRYRFKMNIVNRIAKICNQTKHFDLIQILLKIIIFQVSQEELLNYKSEDLMTFLSMMRSYHPAESVQNVCTNYMSNAQADGSANGTAPANNTIATSALPSARIPSLLGLPF